MKYQDIISIDTSNFHITNDTKIDDLKALFTSADKSLDVMEYLIKVHNYLLYLKKNNLEKLINKFNAYTKQYENIFHNKLLNINPNAYSNLITNYFKIINHYALSYFLNLNQEQLSNFYHELGFFANNDYTNDFILSRFYAQLNSNYLEFATYFNENNLAFNDVFYLISYEFANEVMFYHIYSVSFASLLTNKPDLCCVFKVQINNLAKDIKELTFKDIDYDFLKVNTTFANNQTHLVLNASYQYDMNQDSSLKQTEIKKLWKIIDTSIKTYLNNNVYITISHLKSDTLELQYHLTPLTKNKKLDAISIKNELYSSLNSFNHLMNVCQTFFNNTNIKTIEDIKAWWTKQLNH